MSKILIAALYVRVSTEMQAEDGFSISAQTRMLTEYCAKNNITVYKVYADEGVSGQKENRPQFQQMIKDAGNKCFDIILVHKFDRFARKVELSRRIKKQLRDSGINIISITEPIEDSPIGFFQEGLMELLSEFYVQNLSLEVKKGHVERAQNGYHSGPVPFGYNQDMSINEYQASIIKQIFDWYVFGGLGITKIAQMLNKNRILSPTGGVWHYSKVRQVLNTIKYIGKIYYAGSIYQGKHDPIIDEDLYNLAHKYIDERNNSRELRSNNFDKYLLLGFLHCGVCGSSIRYQSNSKNSYYVCNRYCRYDRPENKCSHKTHHNINDLELSILSFIKNPLKQIEMVENAKFTYNNYDFVKNREFKIKEELEKSRQAYLKEIFTEEEYLSDKMRLTAELQEINKMSTKQSKKETVKFINNVLEKFETVETIAEKKAELKKFIGSIDVYPSGNFIINMVLNTAHG
jgi:site-specific DNA recombinase